MIRILRFWLFLSGCLIATCALGLGLIDDSIGFDAKNAPIYKSRIFEVPNAQVRRAKQLLAGRSFMPLAEKSLEQLFPAQAFEPAQMLSAQADAAARHALEMEGMLKNPFFNVFDWVAPSAKAHRDLERYTRGLRDLQPYLVAAQAYNRLTGNFLIRFDRSTLIVHHSALGPPGPRETVPMVVFVERKVSAVKTIVSGGL